MLELEGLGVAYDGVVVLDGIDLSVGDGEVVVLLGPSGSGKSTLLRAVAGLEETATGVVAWDGEDLSGAPPHRRGFGLVFQDHALFPHMDVAANVAFGLRVEGATAGRRATAVEEALELVGMSGFGSRRVDTLSGGEAQRVALARSIAPGPRLLMLDEPLGSLDRALRNRLIGELGPLLRRLGQASIHVTHDHDEAFALADRIAVLGGGCIQRAGSPVEVWTDPVSAYVARCLGHQNLVELDNRGSCALGRLGGGPGTVLLRPDRLVLSADGDGVEALVVGSDFRGDRFSLRLSVGGQEVAVSSPEGARVGSVLRLGVGSGAVVPLAG